MRRRLVVAMVGVTALSLVLAGMLSLVIAGRVARDAAERELVDQAIAIGTRAGSASTFQVLSRVAEELRFDDINRVTFASDGSSTGALPEGLTADDVRPDLLRAGNAVSGRKGDLIYAAAPVRGLTAPEDAGDAAGLTTVVVTRRVDIGLQQGGAWFLLAAAVSLVAAGLVALALGRRFAAPVRRAREITAQIASGDLQARVGPVAGGPELVDLAESIDAMAESLERAQVVERDFLLSISHDLRTPLTSITGYAEAIADRVADDPAAAADVIRTEAARLDRLVTDLLELAKLDARQFSLHPRAVDLAELVRSAVAGFRPTADEAGVRLQTDLDRTGAMPEAVHVDPDRLAQVLANLIENALNYAASQVVVGITLEDRHISICVDDDGPGMDSEEAQRAFERFYRGDRRRGRNIGSGIGLAIVQELVGALDAEVRANRSPLGGTRMEVRAELSTWMMTSSTRPAESSS